MRVAPSQSRGRPAAKLVAVAAAWLLGLAGAPSAAENPFDGLIGSWSGSGTVTYASGTTERLKCKVKYDKNAEDSVQQVLRCASDSYKFQINAYYRSAGATLSGHWDELVLQVSGSITGNVSDSGKITGSLHGPGFLAAVLVDTKGNEQTVTISSEGQDIRKVAIAVRRGN